MTNFRSKLNTETDTKTHCVSAVVLNWNGLDDTLRCLNSLKETKSSAIQTRILVIDNGSALDPGDQIKRNFPDVDYVRLEANIGFAAACNLGATRALGSGADFVVFLNNDTLVKPNLFEVLLTCFVQDPSIAAASPLIYDMSDPRQIDYAGGCINFALGRFRHQHRAPRSRVPFETDYISGCCMMVSKAAVDRIGFFDEKLFAYFEDVDLCLRIRRAGFKIVCVPATSIEHAGSASTRRNLTQGTISPLKHYLYARNRVVIVDRYGSRLAKWFHLLVANQLRIVFYVAAFVLRRRWSKLHWFLRGISDGVHNNLTLPTEFISSA